MVTPNKAKRHPKEKIFIRVWTAVVEWDCGAEGFRPSHTAADRLGRQHQSPRRRAFWKYGYLLGTAVSYFVTRAPLFHYGLDQVSPGLSPIDIMTTVGTLGRLWGRPAQT